jgi:hypothetical protein
MRSSVRILEIEKCGRCCYFREIGLDPTTCEETGAKVKYAQAPPKSCPLPTVKDFVDTLAEVIR